MRRGFSLPLAAAIVLAAAVLVAPLLATGPAHASWFLSGHYSNRPAPQPAPTPPDPEPAPAPPTPEPAPAPGPTVYYGGWARIWLQPSQPAPQPTPSAPDPKPTHPAPDPEPDPEPTPPPQDPGQIPTHILGHSVPAGLPHLEVAMLEMVNSERTQRGLRPLVVDPVLTALARLKSHDLVTNRYFAHTSPTFGSPFEMMRAAGVSFRAGAENLSSAGNVYVSHYRLMNSDGHRRNILRSDLTHIGIGIVPNSGGVMVTQLFIRP